MSAGGMNPDIYQHFRDDEEIVEYYSRNLSRPQVNRLAEIESTSIPGTNIPSDCEILLEDGALETFHEYTAELFGIGSSTIIEGIRALDTERMTDISDREMDEKQSLILYLIDWDWRDKLEIIKALKTFKTKRTYKRKQISGERSFEDLTDDVKEELRAQYEQELPEINERRKHKVKFKGVDIIEDTDLMIRFDAEAKASRYRQFRFREQEDWKYEADGEMETEIIKYWPLTTEYLYIDYGRKEYDYDISRSEENLTRIAIETLFEDADFGEDVEFADPTDFEDSTPQDFVASRIEDQKEALEDTDLLNDGKKEQYANILDDLDSVEQTAIVLENVNVEGNPTRIEIETDDPISDFLGPHNLEERLEEFNQKSQQREYTLRLGDREIHVSGSKISIMGSISKDEEQVITSLLRKDGASV
ncbi:hypothetical protein [Haladaptatus salinisoli]|uniref:hypothetical protein n=1 Tax=Haladaptatus salinisoli TaxID=2884876 RepID=UPI001D09E8DD|nr:hypothetical protein [Haladaptatus salinisoli]